MAEKIDQAIKEEALQMIREGVTGVEVARRFGVHKDTIRKWRKAAGLSGIGSEMKKNQSKNPEIIREVLALIDEGKNDTEISKIIGLSKYHLRRIRDDNGRPRSQQWANPFTVELINTVIDMIREGGTLQQIHEETGISKKRLVDLRREEIREGNDLPEFKKGIARRQKYSDEELIELAFLNPGYGFKRFIEYLGVTGSFVLDLFIQFKEFTQGKEDPMATLNDPDYVSWVTKEEYRRVIGGPPPRGYAKKGKARKANLDAKQALVPVPPINFNWGPFEPKD